MSSANSSYLSHQDVQKLLLKSIVEHCQHSYVDLKATIYGVQTEIENFSQMRRDADAMYLSDCIRTENEKTRWGAAIEIEHRKLRDALSPLIKEMQKGEAGCLKGLKETLERIETEAQDTVV
jgi:hypothetical protein